MSTPSGFNKLPSELQTMIYEYSLCTDGVLVPHPKNFISLEDPKSEMPAVGLLTVNKQIRLESLPILFSKNIWSIPSWAKINCGTRLSREVFVGNVRHLKLSFSFKLTRIIREICTQHGLYNELHDGVEGYCIAAQREQWARFTNLHFPRLQKLEINTTQVNYLAGPCCYAFWDDMLESLDGVYRPGVELGYYDMERNEERECVEGWVCRVHGVPCEGASREGKRKQALASLTFHSSI